MENLTAHLHHRGGITENERQAADFILKRFRESAPFAEIEDFYSIDAYPFLFAMYYAEFLFVGLFAAWVPWVMFGYGLAVFLLYMAEFTGYSAMSRFMPHYETQNVTSRFPCAAPKRLLIITAHYDSPRMLPWTNPRIASRLRLIHVVLVCCMVLVLMSCAADGLGVFANAVVRVDLLVRWSGVTVLLGAAMALYTGIQRSEFTPGANNNASGTSVLLDLADRLKENSLENTEVWLVATGSKEMWLSGMRQLFRGLKVDKSSTYFLNIAGVGQGTLRYVTGEGMLHVYSADKELVRAAEASAGEYGAKPLAYHGLPTDALIPLARGYKAMGITATVENDLPAYWNRDDDTLAGIDPVALDGAADFVEELVRRMDADPA